MTDKRPANCRFRLRDEAKPYPRSSCQGCGKSIVTGLGNHCTEDGRELHADVKAFLDMLIRGPELGKTFNQTFTKFATAARDIHGRHGDNLPHNVKTLIDRVIGGPQWGASLNHTLTQFSREARRIQMQHAVNGATASGPTIAPRHQAEDMGMDAVKWAAEFRRTSLELGLPDMDEGWLIGWFANAIMAGYDTARNRYDPEARAALGMACEDEGCPHFGTTHSHPQGLDDTPGES